VKSVQNLLLGSSCKAKREAIGHAMLRPGRYYMAQDFCKVSVYKLIVEVLPEQACHVFIKNQAYLTLSRLVLPVMITLHTQSPERMLKYIT
jgi:hypothetical protein